MLDEYIQIDKADVYKAGRLAGKLRRESDYVSFNYTEEYLASSTDPVATTSEARNGVRPPAS